MSNILNSDKNVRLNTYVLGSSCLRLNRWTWSKNWLHFSAMQTKRNLNNSSIKVIQGKLLNAMFKLNLSRLGVNKIFFFFQLVVLHQQLWPVELDVWFKTEYIEGGKEMFDLYNASLQLNKHVNLIY